MRSRSEIEDKLKTLKKRRSYDRGWIEILNISFYTDESFMVELASACSNMVNSSYNVETSKKDRRYYQGYIDGYMWLVDIDEFHHDGVYNVDEIMKRLCK